MGWMRFLGLAVATWMLCLPVVIAAQAAQQSTATKVYCTRVGGKVTANPNKAAGRLPYLCTYPDKYDLKCERENGVGWYYDLDYGDCDCDDLVADDCW